jgi:hypothetical protein
MDGPFWVDLRAPHMSADTSSTTLTTTAVAILPTAMLPVLGSNYFGFVGKAVRMRIWGQMTAVATPGNITAQLFWGTNANANGTSLVATAATALTAGTNLSWELDIFVRCRSLGSSGSLIAHGMLNANVALIASTLQPVMLPASAASATTVDLTANNVLSPQMIASGSAGSAVIVHEYTFEAMN